MNTSDFSYFLPPDRIAQEPMKPRDRSRLLVLDRTTGERQHRRFFEIGGFLKPGDLLVVNESKVFKARLLTDSGVEIFLLRPTPSSSPPSQGGEREESWIALAKPGRKLKVGTSVGFEDGTSAEVVEKRDDGTVVLDFGLPTEDILAWTDRVGSVPTPPYVDQPPADVEEVYQTVYAKTVGSVAAPTAGFHFTPELIADLKAKGIRFATVTLHVGLGTFRPIKTDTIEEHEMHEEWVDVPQSTIDELRATKERGGHVIAVGTTTVRALESLPLQKGEMKRGFSGFTNLFITPGYRFKSVDGLITNFHLPKSTLLVLVSSFVGEKHDDPNWGRKTVLAAYEDAVKSNYRFYSFGDAMLID